jgi:CheY-like chemotaxis protein
VAAAHFPGVMTLQILVVEDHGDTRRVLTGLLGHFGHSISAADNVESALAFVRAKHFDAIVSDLALPDGSGYDVIREAKRCQQLTGVALTANAEDDDIACGRDAGFDYHLTKPIDFAQLRDVLGHIAPANNGEVSFDGSDSGPRVR